MRLTEKQKRFCDFYMETGSAAEAAVKAGYSKRAAKSMGQENLAKSSIQSYIQKQLAVKDAGRIASPDEVLEYLTDVMRGKYAESKDRIRAAELLGKCHRMFTDKMELTGRDGGAIETIDKADQDALEERINELNAKRKH